MWCTVTLVCVVLAHTGVAEGGVSPNAMTCAHRRVLRTPRQLLEA